MSAQSSFDIAGIALAADGAKSITGIQFAPLLGRTWATAYLEGSGSAARFENGQWSADVDGLVAWRPWAPGSPGTEFVAGAGGARASGGDLTSHLWGRLRMHHPIDEVDLWFGAGGGRVDGLLGAKDLGVAEAGAIWSDTHLSASVLAVPTWIEGGTRYVDVSGSLRAEGDFRVTGVLGFRQQWAPAVVDRGWLALSVEHAVTATSTVVLSAGSFPADPAQGFVDGRYVTLAIRIGRADRAPFGPPRSARAATTAPRWERAGFSVRPLGGDRYELVATIPDAERVEIAGDFSEWRPLALLRLGERWVAQVTLTPGVHRVNLRTDGGAWRAPPSLPATTDDFGGQVGTLVVP